MILGYLHIYGTEEGEVKGHIGVGYHCSHYHLLKQKVLHAIF